MSISTKMRKAQAMFFFPVTLYEIDSWTLKKQDRNSTDTLELYIGEDF